MGDRRYNVLKPIAWTATLTGLVLFSGMFWADVLNPLVFNSAGAYRTDGMFPLLSPILLRVNMALHLGWFYGLPFLFLGTGGLVFIYARTNPRFPALQSRGFGTVALVLAIAAHLLIFLFSVQFFFVPAGSQIRPMGWALFVGLVSAGVFIVVEPVSIISLFREKPRFLGVLGMVLGITPFPFSSFILHLAARIKGFELSP
jgi:hypothetical protein